MLSVNCRSQHWGNTTHSGGLRRICWRSRGRGLEPMTRRRASWEDRCLSWMQKVSLPWYQTVITVSQHSFLCVTTFYCLDVDSLLKKSESQHESPEDGCPFGPLTQRLLQALVEVWLISWFSINTSKTPIYIPVLITVKSLTCVFFPVYSQENIISPMEDSPIPDISGRDANDGAGTSPRSQGKAFRYLCYDLLHFQSFFCRLI